MALTREALIQQAGQALANDVKDAAGFAATVADVFATVTDSEIVFSDDLKKLNRAEIFRLDPFTDSGISVKPGNILFNWQKLFNTLPGIALTAVSVTQWWLVPLAALYMCSLVWTQAKVAVSANHASVITALWLHNAGRMSVPESEALAIANEYRLENKLPALAEQTFVQVVDDLVQLHTLALRDGMIQLIETVRAPN